MPKPQREKDLPFLYNPGSLIPRCCSAKINARKQIEGVLRRQRMSSIGFPSVQEAVYKKCKQRTEFPGIPRQNNANAFGVQYGIYQPSKSRLCPPSPLFPFSSPIPHIYPPLSATVFPTLKPSAMCLKEVLDVAGRVSLAQKLLEGLGVPSVLHSTPISSPRRPLICCHRGIRAQRR